MLQVNILCQVGSQERPLLRFAFLKLLDIWLRSFHLSGLLVNRCVGINTDGELDEA